MDGEAALSMKSIARRENSGLLICLVAIVIELHLVSGDA